MAAPYRISIGVNIDAAGAKTGGASAQQAVDAIGAAAEKARPKIEQVTDATTKLGRTGGSGAAAAGFAAIANEAAKAESKVQQLINAAVGLNNTRANDNQRRWTGLFGDESMSADRLRAKYNPLFAVIQQYKAAQVEIRTANAMGALSTDEMTVALSRQRQAALAAIDAIKGRNAAVEASPRLAGNGAGAFQTANIAAQFQDIAVTSAMGMSPLQIALQQGTQLSAVIASMDSPVKGLAAAFMSIVSPVSLVTIGVVALGAAAIQYFTQVKDGTRTVDDILARHADNIAALGPAYKKALEEQKAYAELSPTIIGARLGDDAKDAQAKLLAEARAARAEIATAMEFNVFGSRGDDSILRFNGAREAIAVFVEGVKAGTPRVEAFQQEIIRLAEAGKITESAAAELRKLTDAALEAETAVAGISGTIDPVGHAFSELQKRIDEVNPFSAGGRLGDLDSKLQDLWRGMRSGQVTVTDLKRNIVSLSSANPDMSSAIEEIGRLGLAALQAMQNVQGLGAAVRTTPKTNRVRAADQNQRDLNFFLRTDEDLKKDLEGQAAELKRANDKSAKAGESAANAYRDLLKSADDRVQQMKLEAQLAGETGIAADTLRFKLDLLQQSEDKGRSLTDKQVQAINARVEAFKTYAEEAAKARLKADLLFEREQFGRSETDQQIASGLRGAGLPVDFDSYEAGLIRTNLQLRSARELTGDVAGTLSSSLQQGKGLWESFGDAGVSALKRIAETLTNDLLNSLFQVQGAGGSSGGGILNSIFSLFGGGGGTSYFPPAPTGSVGLFDRGGYTGDGPVHKPAGVVHAGEVVFSQADVRRHGGPAVVDAIRLGRRGYANGGVVDVTPLVPSRLSSPAAASEGANAGQKERRISVDVTGARGNAEIQEMVAKGVTQGLREYDAALPDRVAYITDNPRRR